MLAAGAVAMPWVGGCGAGGATRCPYGIAHRGPLTSSHPQLPLFSALCSVPASLGRTGCSSAAFCLTLEQLHKQAEPRLFSAQRFIDNLCLSTV